MQGMPLVMCVWGAILGTVFHLGSLTNITELQAVKAFGKEGQPLTPLRCVSQ